MEATQCPLCSMRTTDLRYHLAKECRDIQMATATVQCTLCHALCSVSAKFCSQCGTATQQRPAAASPVPSSLTVQSESTYGGERLFHASPDQTVQARQPKPYNTLT
eukprot:NODE_1269_length_633_cov_791.333904_g999_i0.p1 GENE.NODE_1269_length_633_cov_791.333904_g999_i0~~NODE_1269_length_633_cov_791.333904_g999_i0.p1  ORF type:complete len:106 (-),score=6.12 NODE_1269_length_633_cov_791.333904_g999_i0:48-365(-)